MQILLLMISNHMDFTVMNLHNDDRHINEIVKEILNQSDLFDLSKGRVIRCHILRSLSFRQ